MILLSIIIPVFNAEKYIRDCLKSLFAQGLADEVFEVILVNDGTPDHSFEVIDDMIQMHDNIIIINQVNKGVSVARNAGLTKATGEYVYFVDPDDILIDNCLSVLINHLTGSQIDILMADYIRFNDGDMSENVLHTVQDYSAVEKTGAEIFCEDLSPYECYIWRMLIRRDFLLHHEIEFKPFWFEDVLFCHECYLKANRCVKASLLLYYYRLHSGSFTSSMNLRKMLDLNSALAGLWDLRGIGIVQEPIVERKLMDNIFRTLSFGLWCISHNEQLCANRRQIVKDLKSKIPPKEFFFSANVKQRIVSFLFRYIPNMYIKFRSSVYLISKKQRKVNLFMN